jgi:hypothetical protein
MNPQWCDTTKNFLANMTLFAAQHFEMLPQMPFQRILFHKLFPTLGTLKLLFAMDLFVQRQLQLALEKF